VVMGAMSLGTPRPALADEPSLTVEIQTDPEDEGPFEVSVAVNGLNATGDTCESAFDGASADLEDGESDVLIECADADAEIGVILTVNTDDPFWEVTSIDCTATNGTDGVVDSILGNAPNLAAGTKTLTIVDEEHVNCSVELNFDELESETGIASVVVTANPNVIECGGTSIITASARNALGHVIPGVGFHFATNTGLLVVLPNNANNEEGIASLTLQPGMPSSEVVVSVGSEQGTIERREGATITVQQFCPGVVVGQNASAAPGQVLLNWSNDNLVCGEQVFVGMKIRDSKGQVPPDGTVVNLLATSGLLEPASVPTKDGVANVTYTAAAINGDVRITAAAGDSYGFTILKVKCATTTGTGSAGPAPCTPIGDGVCIAPPNTGGGNRITPPNTGEAGLK